MSDGRKYYCFCEANCKFETMTKEQILATIAQAAESGLVFDTEAAFITKIKEQNKGDYLQFWVGTQAEYNALTAINLDCHYIITDSTRDADIAAALKALAETDEELAESIAEAHEEIKGKAGIDHTHNYSLGMVREFEVTPNAKTYSTEDTLSKFYILTIEGDYIDPDSGNTLSERRTVTIDYRAITAGFTNNVDASTRSLRMMVSATAQTQTNGKKYVFFSLAYIAGAHGDWESITNVRILHIAGYY